MEKQRLSKLMATQGFCSRREADVWIQRGWVFVNGEQVTELGTKILPSDKIEISEHAKQEKMDLVTIVLNKPIGWVSSQPEDGYSPAIELLSPENGINFDQRRIRDPRNLSQLAVAGRLDIDSQGILVFTQDGTVARTLIQADSEIEKEYLVRFSGSAEPAQIQKLREPGFILDGVKLKPVQVDWIHENQLRMVLKEGKKRQIRRMLEAVGLEVAGLKRVRVGKIRLGELPEGKWRYLSSHESF